jgi:hypothetical protein
MATSISLTVPAPSPHGQYRTHDARPAGNHWGIRARSGTIPSGATMSGAAIVCLQHCAEPVTRQESTVRTGPEDRLVLIQGYYQAYENDDRAAIEQLLHPAFTFTSPSPDDDRIDRATYFERCWPPHERFKRFTLVDVCADDQRALVRYRAEEFTGPGFANVEYFEFDDDLIAHVDVYFGRGLG